MVGAGAGVMAPEVEEVAGAGAELTVNVKVAVELPEAFVAVIV